MFGAQLHDVYWDGGRDGACKAISEVLQRQGKRPFIVPYGASSAPGAAAYASVLAEIAQQANALGMDPAAIVHASASGATQAGLVVGASVAMPQTKIIGIDIGSEPDRAQEATIAHVEAAAMLLDVELSQIDVEVARWRAKPHYGLPHESTLDAIELAAVHEGLMLDPVCSGKGLAGLISLVKSGRWKKDCDVIFVHTGGMLSSHTISFEEVDAAA